MYQKGMFSITFQHRDPGRGPPSLQASSAQSSPQHRTPQASCRGLSGKPRGGHGAHTQQRCSKRPEQLSARHLLVQGGQGGGRALPRTPACPWDQRWPGRAAEVLARRPSRTGSAVWATLPPVPLSGAFAKCAEKGSNTHPTEGQRTQQATAVPQAADPAGACGPPGPRSPPSVPNQAPRTPEACKPAAKADDEGSRSGRADN